MLGIRGKLFVTSLVLMLAVGGATLIVLERGLGGFLRAKLASDLSRRLAIAQQWIEHGRHPRAAGALDDDAMADSLGLALDARVTVFDQHGRVIGDSEHEPSQLAGLGSSAQRPEVAAAIEWLRDHDFARAADAKPIERGRVLYAATSFARSGDIGLEPWRQGVVRVGVSTIDVDTVLDRLRFFLLIISLAGIGVALLMSGLASFWASRELVSLVQNAGALATGGRSRLEIASGDELGSLAGSFNRLAERLERTVAELKREHDRFEAILGQMGEAVIALDPDDRVQLANRAALELLEVPEVRPGQPVVDLVRAPAFADLLPRVRAQGKASTELTVGKSSTRQVLARAARLEATSGIVIVMLDVTEMRRLEAVRRDFVANVSHELRTPISIIQANAETLLDGALTDPERGPGFAHAIMRSAERLGRIVADLLDLSRIESGEQPRKLRPLPIADVVFRVVDSLQLKARARSMTLSQDVPEDLEPLCDEDSLEQILTNLVDNAIKYTPVGGHVVVRAAADGDRVRIDVCDDGPGIEPRHRERIFERFYRVDPGRSRDMGGTGLGLSIVKHLAEAQDGSVELLDNEPTGCVFRVWLRTG
jgi:two-component system phosphate regulon sensor histidine kinase PhoR